MMDVRYKHNLAVTTVCINFRPETILISFFLFYRCTLHLDIIKVTHSPIDTLCTRLINH